MRAAVGKLQNALALFGVQLAELVEDIQLVFGEVEGDLHGLMSEGELFSHTIMHI